MWIYCGGRTSKVFVSELAEEVKAFNQVNELLELDEGEHEVKGIFVTDMSLSLQASWEDIWKLSNKYQGVQVVVITTRELDIPPQELLPENVRVNQVDRLRVDHINDLMLGGTVNG